MLLGTDSRPPAAMHRWWVFCVPLVLAACGGGPAPDDEPYVPRHAAPFGIGDAALLQGTAVYEDGCLFIVAGDGTRYLPLWPVDALLGMINSEPAILGPDGELLVESGDAFVDIVELGGSEATAERAAEILGDIPERCANDRFWVVGDVLNRP